MGAAPGEEGPLDDSETPQHQVELSRGFYLAKYELTQAQWRAVVGTQPWRRRQYVKEGAQYPATYISWIEAAHFIQRLNKKAGKTLYRFPTEAEWEYACRAGGYHALVLRQRRANTGRLCLGQRQLLGRRREISSPCRPKSTQRLGALRYARQCLGMGRRLGGAIRCG